MTVTSKQIATRMMNENWETNERLRRYLSATTDDQAVTGERRFDTCLAAQLVVELAAASGFVVPEKDLGRVADAIGSWLTARGLARMQRAGAG
jgi:hypothetical protein